MPKGWTGRCVFEMAHDKNHNHVALVGLVELVVIALELAGELAQIVTNHIGLW